MENPTKTDPKVLPQKNIRNFCIIAHIDHGKSTLADRMLEKTRTIPLQKMQEQILDSNPIERERGVTIKLAPARMIYSLEGEYYILNLIDTPGHVDFSYEVSRSLAACEGAIILIDATQGIQAQTLSHLKKAKDQNLKVIPVINKIDLPNARPDVVAKEIEDTFSFDKDEIVFISAKTGEGIDKLLKELIVRIPAPSGKKESPFRALIFNSIFDPYRGVIVFVRVVDGVLESRGEPRIEFIATSAKTQAKEMGYFTPMREKGERLSAGEVGFIATGLKDIALCKVGDTVVSAESPFAFPLPGYAEPKPMIFQSLFPENPANFQSLEESLSKLKLSDSSLSFSRIESMALGKGVRCGFLGLFHAEIVSERLKVEYSQDVIPTSPNINYKVTLKDDKVLFINDPSRFPSPKDIESIEEPFVTVTIFSPKSYVGRIMELCQKRRGIMVKNVFKEEAVEFVFEMPLSEIISDFFDALKSQTQGFATLDYEFLDFRKTESLKVDFLLNDNLIDPISIIAQKEDAENKARKAVEKLRTLIQRQQFEVKIQAVINGKIIASAKIPPFRKDVTQKLYGGDRTRKDKLLEAQKKGKKKMATIGKIEIPNDVFGRFLRE
jgi:GTP-binding protein LepA